MVKIFLTGATGYIGGEVLHVLQATNTVYNTVYEVTALVRSADGASKVSAVYPSVRIVLGDLDATTLIEDEARKADIVIHTASTKHLESVQAIVRGLTPRDTYYIQISGASVLACAEIESQSFGNPSTQVIDDLDNVEDVKSIIRAYPVQRAVDNYLLDLGSDGPETAIVFPPIIFGTGRGPGNKRSIQVPELIRIALEQKSAIYVGQGLNRWSSIHIADLADLVLGLVKSIFWHDARPLWNDDGLYFAENGQQSFKDIAIAIAKEGHKLGLVPSPSSVKFITSEEVDKLFPDGSVVYGTNAVGKALRARTLFGWAPSRGTLEEYISEAVAAEAEHI